MERPTRQEIYPLHAEICAGLADPTRILCCGGGAGLVAIPEWYEKRAGGTA